MRLQGDSTEAASQKRPFLRQQTPLKRPWLKGERVCLLADPVTRSPLWTQLGQVAWRALRQAVPRHGGQVLTIVRNSYFDNKYYNADRYSGIVWYGQLMYNMAYSCLSFLFSGLRAGGASMCFAYDQRRGMQARLAP